MKCFVCFFISVKIFSIIDISYSWIYLQDTIYLTMMTDAQFSTYTAHEHNLSTISTNNKWCSSKSNYWSGNYVVQCLNSELLWHRNWRNNNFEKRSYFVGQSITNLKSGQMALYSTVICSDYSIDLVCHFPKHLLILCLSSFFFITISWNVYLFDETFAYSGSAGFIRSLYCGNVVLPQADVDGACQKSERMGSYIEENAYCPRSRFIVLPCSLGKKKKLLCCPHPTKIWKLGRSVDFLFFFIFTYRERVEFSNIFFKVSKWGKLRRNAVKTHIQVLF